jgi:hypothetical protein
MEAMERTRRCDDADLSSFGPRWVVNYLPGRDGRGVPTGLGFNLCWYHEEPAGRWELWDLDHRPSLPGDAPQLAGSAPVDPDLGVEGTLAALEELVEGRVRALIALRHV